MNKLGGRKVVMSLVAIIVGVAVALIKGDIPPNLLTLLNVIVGAFVAGNVGVHIASSRKPNGGEGAPAPVVDLSSIEQQNDKILESLNVTQQGVSYILSLANPKK